MRQIDYVHERIDRVDNEKFIMRLELDALEQAVESLIFSMEAHGFNDNGLQHAKFCIRKVQEVKRSGS